MHFITLFVAVFVTLAFIGIDYTLANCDCDHTSHGCLDRCINEARSCIADCNTRALSKNNDVSSCHSQCLQRYWPEIEFNNKMNHQGMPEEVVDEEENDMDKNNVDEETKLVVEEDEKEVVADEDEDALIQEAEEENVDEEPGSIQAASIAEENEEEQEENVIDGAEIKMNIDEENFMEDENNADLVEDKEDYEGYSSDEQLASEDEEEEEENENEDEELDVGDVTVNGQQQQQHRNNIFAVSSSHKKEQQDDDQQQEMKDDEEYYAEVTQDGIARTLSASGEKVDAYFDSNPTKSGNGQHTLLTVTAYTTMTSHVTVMPNGKPISSNGPSHGPDGMNGDINGAVGNTKSSAAIVTLMAIACAYFLA